jgi:hypothetical protein
LLIEFLKKFLDEDRDDDIIDPALNLWAKPMSLLPGIAYRRLRWPRNTAGFQIAQITPRTGRVDGKSIGRVHRPAFMGVRSLGGIPPFDFFLSVSQHLILPKCVV